jgi:hypothetical protein
MNLREARFFKRLNQWDISIHEKNGKQWLAMPSRPYQDSKRNRKYSFILARTPRGGWHFYFEAKDGLGNATGFIPGCDFRGKGGYIIAPPSKGYTWMQGLGIDEVPAAPLAISIYKNLSLYRACNAPSNAKVFFDASKIPVGKRDEMLFHVANHLARGNMPPPEIANLLNTLARYGCEEPFPKGEIPAKIESALQRIETREQNLSQEISLWVSVTQGYFSVTQCDTELQIVTKQQKINRRQVFFRLVRDGILEKHDSREGIYRKVDKEAELIDWENASAAPVDLSWPLQLEKIIELYPKNLAVIAGTKDAGKTTFAMNFAFLNRDRFKVRYLSSEMGREELKKRISLFGTSFKEWKKIEFRNKSQEFSNFILPDALNIIDYYEIDRDFWRAAGDLRKVYEKLNSGIALVCLQKSKDKDMGRGGDFSLEKPRLYLNLDSDPPKGNLLTIREAKAWPDGAKNPNWQKIRFKIVKGSEIIRVDDWYME